MIKAEIVAHSLSPQGDELISVLCTFPRIILAEVNTHRMLSKNTSSSRAIPFKKMVEAIESNPFIPIAWQKNHSGMQGTEYLIEEKDIEKAKKWWLGARNFAVEQARELNEDIDVTKQLANRLLEPFMWTTMLITGSRSGWDNFFHLRCPQYEVSYFEGADKNIGPFRSKKEFNDFMLRFGWEQHQNYNDLDFLKINKGQAEIHIMDLAEKIWDALNESTPKQLKVGDWHIPFRDKIVLSEVRKAIDTGTNYTGVPVFVKISTAMAARTSYTIVGDEKEINYEKMVGLHDKLLSQNPPHSSPLEHCARAMSHEEYKAFIRGEGQKREAGHYKSVCGNPLFDVSAHGWCNNFKGFIQYRYLIDNKITL